MTFFDALVHHRQPLPPALLQAVVDRVAADPEDFVRRFYLLRNHDLTDTQVRALRVATAGAGECELLGHFRARLDSTQDNIEWLRTRSGDHHDEALGLVASTTDPVLLTYAVRNELSLEVARAALDNSHTPDPARRQGVRRIADHVNASVDADVDAALDALETLLASLPDVVVDVLCHPGTDRRVLRALTAAKTLTAQHLRTIVTEGLVPDLLAVAAGADPDDDITFTYLTQCLSHVIAKADTGTVLVLRGPLLSAAARGGPDSLLTSAVVGLRLRLAQEGVEAPLVSDVAHPSWDTDAVLAAGVATAATTLTTPAQWDVLLRLADTFTGSFDDLAHAAAGVLASAQPPAAVTP